MVPSRVEEISRLSLSLLHLLHEVAKESPAEAAMYFGVSEDIARSIAECSIQDLQSLAAPGVMLFAPRIRSTQLRQFIDRKGSPLEQARAVAIALAR